jgi:two-component system, OmpR family, sensor histidine kinase BaeS
MYSIRKKLGIILVACSVIAIVFSAILVNFTINKTFNKYVSANQDERNKRIVQYFEEIYKRDNKWSENSGIEIIQEAYVGNYCLTLLNYNKKVIWQMNLNTVGHNKRQMMDESNQGIYNSQTFEIKNGNNIVGYVTIGQFSSMILSNTDINFRSSINRSIVLSVLITLIIVILISIMLSKQFSNPIKEVSDTSVLLSKGKYNARSKTETNIIELSKLRESINTLGEKLEMQDDLRRRLVSDISHEIRTPLNILENNLEAMIDGVFPVTNERLESLNDEVIRFGKLLENLNTIKELEAEDAIIKLESINLEEVLESVVKDFELSARNKNITLNFNYVKENNYKVLGDSDELKQVFINILSNSIKFTHENGLVIVNIKENKNNIIVSVKDNGIGIKKEDLPFIFERLYRGDKSRHETDGSGIGLTIVKKILMLHNASIEAQSEEGVGTTFVLNFNKEL